jgi:hypothetical protein
MIGELMAKALQPAVTAGEIFFELDRFELGDGDRLELSGRWFGVRGRRFVRPSLALIAESGRSRALADLEHKPWAPEDGQAWEAAFPWYPDTDVLEAELSVSPDITIRLPAPSAALDSAQRLEVIPRDDHPTVRPLIRGRDDKPAENETESPAPKPRQRRAAKPPDGKAELDALRAELSAVRSELEQVRSELEAALAAGAESANAAATAGMELAAAQERRDAAVSGLQAAIEARDAANRARDQAGAERDRERDAREQLAAERDRSEETARRVGAELDQAQAALEQAVRERQEATQARDRAIGERDALVQSGARLAHERDEAIASRGAAMVMRNATRALPGHDHHAGWVQRGGAIVVLIGAVFALLAVLHVL